MRMFSEKDHTFVICAYKESEYLESMIQSLINQNKKSTIIVTTSTPNQHIENLASKYELDLYIRKGRSDIAKDWNFAYQKASTKLVTLCHQDDIYKNQYTETMINSINKNQNVLIAFSDYMERKKEEEASESLLIKIKKIMLYPLIHFRGYPNIIMRRIILSFGNPICCPSVTYVKENLPKKIFNSRFKSNIDWDAWERLSKHKGNFVFISQKLVEHRIHTKSTTSILIGNEVRTQEDFTMFCRFWPRFFAKILNIFYRSSEKFNYVEEVDE